jgi:hypothetical protein
VSLLADQPRRDALAAVLAAVRAAVLAAGALAGFERCGRPEAVLECQCCGRSLCGECSLQPGQLCHHDADPADVASTESGPTGAPR